MLTKYLRQLRDCVSLVTKEHEQLVGIILVGSFFVVSSRSACVCDYSISVCETERR